MPMPSVRRSWSSQISRRRAASRPPVVTVVPIYMMFQSVRLLDTHIALILTYTVVNLPIVVWLMHDFFVSIPIGLEESAQLDGASRMTIFYEIVLPLAKAGLAATTPVRSALEGVVGTVITSVVVAAITGIWVRRKE